MSKMIIPGAFEIQYKNGEKRNKMLVEKRQQMILNMLEERKSVTVTEIKEALGISESTIRRDLNMLDKEGRLVKVFGGAIAVNSNYTAKELSVSQKLQVNENEKRKIAKMAAELIKPSDFVYLDAGTTTGYMIEYINCKEATFVTNAVAHAKKLAVSGFHVILIGGELKGTTEAVVGNEAILSIQNYNFTKGFFGTNGVSLKNGFTTPDANEALVKKTAINQCNHKYMLADSAKFDNVTSVKFANFENIHILTDKVPDKYKHCRSVDVEEV